MHIPHNCMGADGAGEDRVSDVAGLELLLRAPPAADIIGQDQQQQGIEPDIQANDHDGLRVHAQRSPFSCGVGSPAASGAGLR